jgi:hypothetical protein
LNVSIRGVWTSIRGRVAWSVLGRGRRRDTLGWPGTGPSYTATSKARGATQARPAKWISIFWWLALLVFAVVAVAQRVSSQSLDVDWRDFGSRVASLIDDLFSL